MKKKAAGICTIEAPCKINLHLKIGEKRPDGFHNLESLFAALAFGDTLRFEETQKGDCHLFVEWEAPGAAAGESIPGESIPREKNLVFRAVSLFRERTGYEKGLDIRLFKRIPTGAGLGGGSSDAASTLLALNSLANTGLTIRELGEMASFLGSDVPFFLYRGAAFVSGRGETIEPLEFKGNLWVVLVKPPFSSNTALAYELLDKARESADGAAFAGEYIAKKRIISALGEDPRSWPYYNDFLPVFLAAGNGENHEKALCYETVLNGLKKEGAVFAGLSGSGSCCFGVFASREEAEKAKKSLSGQRNFTKLTFFLAYNADPVLK